MAPDSKSSGSRESSPKDTSPPKDGSRPASQTETRLLPPEHWAQAPEEHESDADSTFDETLSSTASLASSVLKYRLINGRNYHSDRGSAEYWGSVDDAQNDALDINHHVLTLLLKHKLHLAPISEDIEKVVDIGTGTGIWAIDFADEFPNASVIGTDIAPIQSNWVPPNLEFQIEDCTQPWTFDPDSIDYIHMRWLAGSIADWDALFEEAYRSLKPGGYVETLEPSSRFESDDGSVTEKSALAQWGKFFVEGGLLLGRPFTVFEDELQRKAMEKAGFEMITTVEYKNPVGSWPKDRDLQEIGVYMRAVYEQDPEGTVLFMAGKLGWSREEVLLYLTHFRKELRAKHIHTYFRQRVVWGRKPL